MCGRFTLTSTPEALAERFALTAPLAFEARYNIAPGQDVISVRQEPAGRLATALRWGLVPHWAQDPSIGNRMINARMESVADKPAFRDALRQRRCVVPADGFFEWAPATRGKQPHHIHRDDGGLFAMAGLWASWRDPQGGALETCTVLTRPARAPVDQLHDRMPVIVEADALEAWLDPGLDDPEELLPLLAESAGPRLTLHPVSERVNRVAIDDPSCVAVVAAAPEQQDLFS